MAIIINEGKVDVEQICEFCKETTLVNKVPNLKSSPNACNEGNQEDLSLCYSCENDYYTEIEEKWNMNTE